MDVKSCLFLGIEKLEKITVHVKPYGCKKLPLFMASKKSKNSLFYSLAKLAKLTLFMASQNSLYPPPAGVGGINRCSGCVRRLFFFEHAKNFINQAIRVVAGCRCSLKSAASNERHSALTFTRSASVIRKDPFSGISPLFVCVRKIPFCRLFCFVAGEAKI